MKSDNINEFASNVHLLYLLSSFKRGGKIQTWLNCEYDDLSEVVLSLPHSKGHPSNIYNWWVG